VELGEHAARTQRIPGPTRPIGHRARVGRAFALQLSNGSVTFSASLNRSIDFMAAFFHIPTIHRLAEPYVGSRVCVAFTGMSNAQRRPAGADALTNGSIAPAWRRAR
jgi:hypothetical protein